MDHTTLALFLFATFIGGLTSGLTGFAMGVVVSSIWLHIISPAQTTTLIVGYGLLTQGYAVWKLRHALNWRKAAPFIVGSAMTIPLGAMLLPYANPAFLRTGVGLMLVLFSAYNLARPAIKPLQVGVPTDFGIGLLNGLIGGLTGLTVIVVTIWCQFRPWPKDEQRMVFQPVNLAAILLSIVSLSFAGTVTVDTAKLYVFGLPFMLVGLWLGLKLYGKLNDATFRKLILWCLLLSGVALIAPLTGLVLTK